MKYKDKERILTIVVLIVILVFGAMVAFLFLKEPIVKPTKQEVIVGGWPSETYVTQRGEFTTSIICEEGFKFMILFTEREWNTNYPGSIIQMLGTDGKPLTCITPVG